MSLRRGVILTGVAVGSVLLVIAVPEAYRMYSAAVGLWLQTTVYALLTKPRRPL